MKLLAGALIAILFLPTASMAVTLFEDDFESETAALNGVPSKWTVSDGTVDILGSGVFGGFCRGNGQCIDMDGSVSDAGKMTSLTNFILLSGSSFNLSFDYSWNDSIGEANEMSFGVGNMVSTLTTPTGAAPSTYLSASFDFVGDNSVGAIFFDHIGGDNTGIIVDNVVFSTPTISTVPLPAGLPMLAFGLAALGLVRRNT